MSNELDPAKYHVLTPMQRKILFILFSFVAVVIFPIIFYFYYGFAINRPAQNIKDATVEINKGDGLNEIAETLYQNDLLNSEFLFKLYVFTNRLDKNMQAGVFYVPAGTSIVNLAQILQHGTNDVRITFPEGWRVEEYARHADASLENVDYEDFVNDARSYEGFLFPDTYFVNKNIRTKDLVDLLRSTFAEKTKEVLTAEALSRVSLTKEEVVIFASIVEREVNRDEDLPLVSGILIKRWREGGLIGADATTQYVLAPIKFGCDIQDSSELCPSESNYSDIQWWPNPATFTVDDLAYDHPYNTRKNAGLPPAPISNPGLSSIKAVLNYEDSSYYYYLMDADGNTHYANTLDEHQLNISRYLYGN